MFSTLPKLLDFFNSTFSGDPSQLQIIKRAVVRFDFNGSWTDCSYHYLDVNPDIARLFHEKHFDSYGKNLIEELGTALKQNPKLIKAVYITTSDLTTRIGMEVLSKIKVTLPPSQDPLVRYLGNWISHAFGKTEPPGEYRDKVEALQKPLTLNELLQPFLPPIAGAEAINKYDPVLLIDEYTQIAGMRVNTKRWYDSDDISDFLELIVEKELSGYRAKEKEKCRFVLQGNKEGIFKENGEEWVVALTPAIDSFALSLPLGYFLDRELWPQGTLLICYQRIQPVIEQLAKGDRKLLYEQLLKLLSPAYGEDVVRYLIPKLEELEFDPEKLKACISSLKKQEKEEDLFGELAPVLQKDRVQVKIFTPYNHTQTHWLTGEIQIRKEHRSYQVQVWTHDPYGRGEMEEESFKRLRTTLIKRISAIQPEAEIKVTREKSPYNRRQAAADYTSCGVIVIEDILRRVSGASLTKQRPYGVGAIELRETHIEKMERYLPQGHRTRENFLQRNTLSVAPASSFDLPSSEEIAALVGRKAPSLALPQIFDEEEKALAEVDKIAVDPVELEKQKKEIRQAGKGGLGIEQTAGALKVLLRKKKQVHVIYSKELSGIAILDNQIIVQQISLLLNNPEWIVFPYGFHHSDDQDRLKPPDHQVAVVIDLNQKVLYVTDSLEIDRSTHPALKALVDSLQPVLGPLNILSGKSNYKRQVGGWECGVHTACNILDQIEKRVAPQQALELNHNLDRILRASLQYAKIAAKLQAERSRKQKEKRELLEAIEKLRDQDGHFSNKSSQDDLRRVADALQIELWGNLDRRKPDSHPGRSNEASLDSRERDIEKLIAQYEKEHPEDILGITVLNLLKRGGNYLDVIEYQRKVLQREKNLHPKEYHFKDQVSQFNSLGAVFHNLGKPIQAFEYFQEALKLAYEEHGIEHPDVANSLSNIGTAYNSLGKPHEAVSCYQKALTIRKKVYGNEHPHVALSLNSIGLRYQSLGKLHEALDYCKRALTIQQKFHETEPLFIVASLNSVGSAYCSLGKPKKALRYRQRALTITEKIYGKEHHYVAGCLSNIGYVYFTLGKAQEALSFYQRALTIWEKAYGTEYPCTALIINNIGYVYCALGKAQEALSYHQKALKIWEKLYGEEHFESAIILNNIGHAYNALGKAKEALPYLQRTLTIWTKAYGNEHPMVVQCSKNIEIVKYNAACIIL